MFDLVPCKPIFVWSCYVKTNFCLFMFPGDVWTFSHFLWKDICLAMFFGKKTHYVWTCSLETDLCLVMFSGDPSLCGHVPCRTIFVWSCFSEYYFWLDMFLGGSSLFGHVHWKLLFFFGFMFILFVVSLVIFYFISFKVTNISPLWKCFIQAVNCHLGQISVVQVNDWRTT